MLEIKYKDILKYRSVWMGVAILMVLFFHSEIETICIVNGIKNLSYCGVDIFVFASGLGCFYSYEKYKDPWAFMKRRILRLAPTLFPLMIIWMILVYVTNKLTIMDIIGNLFCVGWLLGYERAANWYISAMWIYYLLIPFWYGIVKNISFKRLLYVECLLFLFCIPFFHHNLLLGVARLPLLFAGMCLGKYAAGGGTLNRRAELALIVLSVLGWPLLAINYIYLAGKLKDYGFEWLPFAFIVPWMCIVISRICNLIQKTFLRKIISLIQKIGVCSLEIFMLNPIINGIGRNVLVWENHWKKNIYELFLIMITVLCGIGIKKLIECSYKWRFVS